MTTRLHRVGRGFDSRFQYGAPTNPIFLTIFNEMAWKGAPVDFFAGLAQMAERLTCNQQVLGSIPRFGFIFLELCLVTLNQIRFRTVLVNPILNFRCRMHTTIANGYHGQSRDKDMYHMPCMQTGKLVQEKAQPMQGLPRRQKT